MLSVIILTHNDEEVISNTLKCLSGKDFEVIILDSYSTDSTLEIVKKAGFKIYQNDFKDFSSQRNFAMSLAHGDWVLYLDSDEVATDEFFKEVQQVMSKYTNGDPVAYFIKRRNFFLGQDWQYTDRMQRLFKKDHFIAWEGKLHETAKIKGRQAELSTPILHNTHRNLSQMLDKTNEWSDYEAELRLKADHPKMSSLRFVRVMLTGFARSYIKEGGYKNGTKGLIESLFQAFSMFVTYAKLFELQETKK